MKNTSEFVSLGHPDKVADYISSYLLDRFLERDPLTRYAVECQIKDSAVTLGGEVTSGYAMSWSEIERHVRDAVNHIGYSADYRWRWGAAAIAADDVRVNTNIGQQSPDIAQGVNREGWGDQGIFWGMATTDEFHGFMPLDHYLAAELGRWLYNFGAGSFGCGIDIKTQVELTDGEVSQVVVAAPCLNDLTTDNLTLSVLNWLSAHGAPDASLIVNGTGRFVTHGPVGDCGTTGRKLAVDFYGGNCRIGGGSPWTKDGTKADVALNLYARKIALQMMRKHGCTVQVSIASVIGRREISVQVLDGCNCPLEDWVEDRPANEIIDELSLRSPRYAHLCELGLFCDIK